MVDSWRKNARMHAMDDPHTLPTADARTALFPSRARRLCLGLLAAAGLGAMAGPALAQPADTYPGKPIRLIVPFPPGGGGDTLARLVMNRAAKELGQPLVVDNVAGAGGNIGSQTAGKAPADG